MRMQIFILGCVLSVFICGGFVAAEHFLHGETMTKAKTAKKWGQEPFNADRFKNGDEKVRASMAFSILADPKPFLKKDVLEIRKILGDPDGFYITDKFPAYIIQLSEQESWQIVFLLDRQDRVSEVIVHKNCCYK